jgi:hypothetical protein
MRGKLRRMCNWPPKPTDVNGKSVMAKALTKEDAETATLTVKKYFYYHDEDRKQRALQALRDNVGEYSLRDTDGAGKALLEIVWNQLVGND